MRRKSELLIEIFFAALLVAFAFRTTFHAGSKGFFALDQSIVFDGGYRVLIGQVPYRDFVMPAGPVAFWVQALFFSLLGVNYYAYIFNAAFLNVLASLFAVGVTRLLFPGRRAVSYGAGFLTAAWFYSPFGTPYFEQTAFFFCFLALYILLLAIVKSSERPFLRTSLLALAGLTALTAFLSKQNAGLFFLPLFPILILANYRRGLKGALLDCAVFLAAVLFSLIAFLAWVHLRSDGGEFLTFFFRVPSQVGRARILSGGRLNLIGYLLMGEGPVVCRIIVGLSRLISVFVIFLYFTNILSLGRKWRVLFLASLSCIYCSFYQYLFRYTTWNNSENCFPFLGIIFGVGAGLVMSLLSDMTISARVTEQGLRSPSRSTLRRLAVLLLAPLFLYSLDRGRAVSFSRCVHEVFARPVFNKPFSIEKLRSLRWGKFTKVRPPWYFKDREGFLESTCIRGDDIVSLIEYLGDKGSRFFVFPDHTIFYGLLEATPPQPLMWFHEGLTYTKSCRPKLDRRIVSDLKKNNVDTIIMEEDSFYGTDERLDDFPLLKEYIEDHFKKAEAFGIFIIYEKSESRREPLTDKPPKNEDRITYPL